MTEKTLLTVTAGAEAGVGLLLLLSPPLVAGWLFGVSLDAPAGVTVGRIAGAALLSLGVACWLSRDNGPGRARRGLIVALLLYNSAAAAILTHAGSSLGLAGVMIWPAVVLHAVLGAWCVACLRSRS